MGLSRLLDFLCQLGQASSAGLVREVRLSKGEAVSFQLPGWLVLNCTGPPGWCVMSLPWCELMDGTLPSLPWWVTSWGLLCFEHLASERWEMCVLHYEFSSWLMFSSRRLSLSICPHLQLLKPVNGKEAKIPWPFPQWDRRETQGSGWDGASKGKCWDLYHEICIFGLFQRLSLSHRWDCTNSESLISGQFKVRYRCVRVWLFTYKMGFIKWLTSAQVSLNS